MSSTADFISDYPGLDLYLIKESWRMRFGNVTQARSRVYSNPHSITGITEIPGINDRFLDITAQIAGSSFQKYRTTLHFSRFSNQWSVESHCSCPVGYLCKHTCALFSLLADQARKIIESPGGNSPIANLQLDAPTIAWLQQLEKATKVSTAPTKIEPPYSKFLAYCIEISTYDSSQNPIMVLHPGSLNKNGTINIEQSIATADITRPPKYMQDSDIRLVTIYRQLEYKLRGYHGVKMHGPGWVELIDGALAENRLYCLHGGRGYRIQDTKKLEQGPAERIEATWETSRDGVAKPILRFDNPELKLIPIEPPYYLDQANSLIGRVESAVPTAILSIWQSGPSVSGAKIPSLMEKLGSISQNTLPVPIEFITENRPIQPPSPILKIIRQNTGPIYRPDKLVIGLPLFRYGDSPALTPLLPKAAPTHIEVVGSTRTIWPRDAKQEARQLQKLLRSGFISLADIYDDEDLDHTTRLAVTLSDTYPGHDSPWLDFLESPVAEALRADGWQLEIDPKAGLSVHDAGDFFTDITADPDHGIDWFRFDMQFELSGQKISLIPIIARMIQDGYPPSDSPDLPTTIAVPCANPEEGFIRFPARRLLEIVEQVCHLFHNTGSPDGPLRVDRLAAAGVADSLSIDSSETTRALAKLGRGLKNITSLPMAEIPSSVHAELRPYQTDGYRWLQFLAEHGLHGILADDMGLGKTLQTLTHLAAEYQKQPGKPSLVIAPTSVVPNWADEAEKFTPHLKILTLQGKDRAEKFDEIPSADVVLTSYPLISRDLEIFQKQDWHLIALDEAQNIKNSKALITQNVRSLHSAQRLCISGTPMENHLGELWSLMRFLMPGFLGDEKSFNTQLRKPIERDHSSDAQLALNRRISPLILRRTKDQVATDLPEKTTLIHHVDLTRKQTDLYESVRASMDKRVRDAIAAKGLSKSHIIVLDALLKLRQICCHPQLLKSPIAQKITESAKLDYLTKELLPTLLDEKRRILLFSQFTSMLALIEAHLESKKIPFLKLTGQTQDRSTLVKQFQTGEIPIFLISLKAGGTGLNLTAADTVIHYDPWWNPAAENQATDRAHRIGQTKPVFVHKLVCRGTIEDRILDLQKHKAALVEALLSEETTKLKIDAETLSHLLAPLDC